jgi:hypothetical protein
MLRIPTLLIIRWETNSITRRPCSDDLRPVKPVTPTSQSWWDGNAHTKLDTLFGRSLHSAETNRPNESVRRKLIREMNTRWQTPAEGAIYPSPSPFQFLPETWRTLLLSLH